MTTSFTRRPTLPESQVEPITLRAIRLLVIVCAFVAVVSFSVRPLSSNDLGYHLAYGDRFLDTGDIVDDDSFIHPRAQRHADESTEIAPGGWFDETGTLRFPNANWLSQIVYSIIVRWMGWVALSALGPVLVGIILLAQAGALRAMKVHMGWIVAVWLATGFIGYERFVLRPELSGYACMAIHMWLLLGRITWARFAAIVAVQVLAVNVHSYWVMNAFMFGAFAAEAVLEVVWSRRKGQTPSVQVISRARRLVLLFVISWPLAAIHPGGLRNVVMPFQTLWFLRANHIAGGSMEQADGAGAAKLHPWALIGEFYSPFGARPWTLAIYWYVAALVCSVPALVVLLWRKKWALLAVLCGFMVTSLSMRRNIAPAAVIAAPLFAFAGHHIWGLVKHRLKRSSVRACSVGAMVAGMALSVWLAHGVMTNRLYENQRSEWRFGTSLCGFNLPLNAGKWLDDNLASPQPIFVDYTASSNFLYFSTQVPTVPILTNTWSIPVERMKEVVFISAGWRGTDIPEEWGMNVAAVQVWPPATNLALKLANDDDWATVFMEGWFLIFMRRTPENQPVIAANEITRDTFDPVSFAAACRKIDPSPVMALRMGGMTLQTLQWFEHAEVLWRLCLEHRDDFAEAWMNLGVCLGQRGEELIARGVPSGKTLLREAQECFVKCLKLDSDNAGAAQNLRRVQDVLRAL